MRCPIWLPSPHRTRNRTDTNPGRQMLSSLRLLTRRLFPDHLFLVQSIRLSARPTEASRPTAPIYSPAVKAAAPLQPRKPRLETVRSRPRRPQQPLRSECCSGLGVSGGRLAFSAFSKPLAFLFSESSHSCPPYPFFSVCLNKPYLATLWRRSRNRNSDWTFR